MGVTQAATPPSFLPLMKILGFPPAWGGSQAAGRCAGLADVQS